MIDMKIDQYHITSNRYGVDVAKMKMTDGEPVTDDKGSVVESGIGNYGNLGNALKGLQAYIVRTGATKITNFEEYRNVNRKIEETFDSYLKNSGVTE